jgi:leucyl-tRNA synthetase
MYDLDLIGYDEPYKRLVNQGMIQGSSRFVYRVYKQIGMSNLIPIFVSSKYKQNIEIMDFYQRNINDCLT